MRVRWRRRRRTRRRTRRPPLGLGYTTNTTTKEKQREQQQQQHSRQGKKLPFSPKVKNRIESLKIIERESEDRPPHPRMHVRYYLLVLTGFCFLIFCCCFSRSSPPSSRCCHGCLLLLFWCLYVFYPYYVGDGLSQILQALSGKSQSKGKKSNKNSARISSILHTCL